MKEKIMKEKKYTDYTYRLVELRDGMLESINTVDNVITQSTELNKIIKASDKADMFKDFVESNDIQITQLHSQRKVLDARIVQLTDLIIDLNSKGDELKRPISVLLEALGAFEPVSEE